MKNNNLNLPANLSEFIKKSFQTIDPGTDYLPNWHIDIIADYLEKAYSGKIRRLIINIPPRSLKSVSISSAFPAWILGKNPTERIIVASYSYILSLKHANDSRLIINSPWFKEMFPNLHLSSAQKYKLLTTKNGFRFATSVGGTLTGEGGNFLIVDDPHNPLQVMSEKYRKRTLNWFDTTFSTRLNNKKKGVIIIVMQRLHENDLTGYLLSKCRNQWELLSLPAISDKRQIIHFNNASKIREKNELLHSSREDWKEINCAKNDLGSFAFSAQYQQNPVSTGGGMIEPAWFLRYDTNKLPEFPFIILSFDTAIKAGNKNNPTVCTIWGALENNFYLLDVYRNWLEYPELKKKAIELANSWKPHAVLIEDKASGQSLIQDLRKESIGSIIPIKANKDKVTRFASVSALIEAGRVYIPFEASWLANFENEIYSFPNGEYDDQVDSLSQFLQWAKNRKMVNRESRYRIRGFN